MIYIIIFIIAWMILGKIALYIGGVILLISLVIIGRFLNQINPRRTGHTQEDNVGS